MKIVTWNVRTMYQTGKLDNIVLETKRMGLAEVRWLQSGKIVCNDHTLIYSGYPGADCGSDHVPIVATIKVKLRTLKRNCYQQNQRKNFRRDSTGAVWLHAR